MSSELWIGFFAIVVPAAVSYLIGKWQNEKTKADVAQMYQKMLKDEITEREQLEKQVRLLKKKVRLLEDQVVEMGGTPITLDDDDEGDE